MPPETTRKPASFKPAASALRVGDHLLLIRHELRLHGLQEAHRLGRDDVHQRPALRAGKDRFVDRRGRISPSHRIMPLRGPRSVLCVVEVTISAHWHGIGMQAGRHQAGDMRHVHQKNRAHRIGDLAETREIDDARIGAAAGDDHLGLVLLGQPGQFVVIDALVLAAHAVGHDRGKSCPKN